jgi:very-short-patch-repair endonuclease
VLDFYCPDIRLAIELDGQHHRKDEEQSAYDNERTEYLKENDIKVLRFFNIDIAGSINAVLGKIKSEVEGTSVSYASPSLIVREGVRGES